MVTRLPGNGMIHVIKWEVSAIYSSYIDMDELTPMCWVELISNKNKTNTILQTIPFLDTNTGCRRLSQAGCVRQNSLTNSRLCTEYAL